MLHFQIDGFFCHRTVFDSRYKIVDIHKTSFGISRSSPALAAPIAEYTEVQSDIKNTFEVPKITQDINIQPFMFGSMDTVQKIIAVHYSTYIRFLYSFPKAGK